LLNAESEGLYTQYTHISTTNFATNTVFTYKVIPKNLVGYGADATVTATTCNVPISMTQPSVVGTVLYNSISLSWSPLTDSV
jgi:hypothetical protein